jgi:hypothetical protein
MPASHLPACKRRLVSCTLLSRGTPQGPGLSGGGERRADEWSRVQAAGGRAGGQVLLRRLPCPDGAPAAPGPGLLAHLAGWARLPRRLAPGLRARRRGRCGARAGWPGPGAVLLRGPHRGLARGPPRPTGGCREAGHRASTPGPLGHGRIAWHRQHRHLPAAMSGL